jgi:hypothetical protein
MFVEETDCFSEQSVQVSILVIVLIRANVKNEIFMFDCLELAFEGLGTIQDVDTTSNEKTGDKTPELDVLAEVGSMELEKPDLV